MKPAASRASSGAGRTPDTERIDRPMTSAFRPASAQTISSVVCLCRKHKPSLGCDDEMGPSLHANLRSKLASDVRRLTPRTANWPRGLLSRSTTEPNLYDRCLRQPRFETH